MPWLIKTIFCIYEEEKCGWENLMGFKVFKLLELYGNYVTINLKF